MVAALATLFMFDLLSGSAAGVDVPYSEFTRLVAAHQVDSVAVGTETIGGLIATAHLDSLVGHAEAQRLTHAASGARWARFVTVRVNDPNLVRELSAAGIAFTGREEHHWLSSLFAWLLPVIFFAAIWLYLLRRMGRMAGGGSGGGIFSIGKSQAKVYMERSTGVSFKDVAGVDEARAELVEIVDFLRNPERYRRLGGKIPKGVLLIGAPGTGKTLLARALAGEASVPFFSLSGSQFVEMFVGVGAARVRDLFLQAQTHAPSIIFIDELDALGRARSSAAFAGAHEEREQTRNQLLAEMDGFDTQKGVIIIAATNRPEILDPALLRPGRFDRKVVVDRPDVKGRTEILRVHTRQLKLAPEVDLAALAARTPGFVGADLASVANEAALAAAREEKDAVEMIDFENAIDRVIAGLERKSRVITPKEKEIVAYHEAGHALVAERRPGADHVTRISIIPRGVAALGYTRQTPMEDRYLLTRTELLDRLDVLLGGRTAEELVFGDVSTGAHDDLERATELVREMVSRYGMSEALGLAAYEPADRAQFLQGPGGPHGGSMAGEYSDDVARTIDAEIKRFLDESHARVRITLRGDRGLLERIAQALKQHEVLDRPEIDAIMADGDHGAVTS